MKFVTMLAEEALPKCIVPVKYVTKFTAMPIVVNLSHASTPVIQTIINYDFNFYTFLVSIFIS